MSPRRANPELAGRRRDVLVRAGYAEILEKGIQGTTLDSVVARAGSSKGGALYYFPMKEDLLSGVLEWLLRQLNRTLDDVLQAQDSARGKLISELEVLFHSAEVNRKLYLVFLILWPSARARNASAYSWQASSRPAIAAISRLLSWEWKNSNSGEWDPQEAAATIRALVDGYCLQWLLGPSRVPIEAYRDRCRAVLGAYLLR
jgi:AcrR family transcriptional regulator